jgi:hypothetical protein
MKQTSNFAIVRVNGRRKVKVVPTPGEEVTVIVPLSDRICDRTTSNPTPRPESSLTCLRWKILARKLTQTGDY